MQKMVSGVPGTAPAGSGSKRRGLGFRALGIALNPEPCGVPQLRSGFKHLLSGRDSRNERPPGSCWFLVLLEDT